MSIAHADTVEPHRLVIRPTIDPRTGVQRAGQRGPMYDGLYQGEVVVEASTQPLLDGARVLAARGLSGPLEMWDETRPYPRMRSSIEAASMLTIAEGSRDLPRFVKWVPFDPSRNAFSFRAGVPQDGDLDV